MRKVAVCASILLACCSSVWATGFAFDGVQTTPFGAGIPVLPGVPTDIYVIADGSADAVTGMNLYLQTTLPFEITGLAVNDIGGAWNSGDTAEGEWIFLYDPSDPFMIPEPQEAVGMVSAFDYGTAPIVDGAYLARVTVVCPVGTAVGTAGQIATESPRIGADAVSGWDMEPATSQGLANLIVVPEPVSLCLLIGGLPLMLRRRRA